MHHPTYSVDGVALDAPGWRLAPGTRLRPLPAARTVEVRVPGRSGDLPVTGLDLEPTVLGITLRVLPQDAQGLHGGFPQLERNLEALTGLFGVRHRLLDVRYHVDPDTVRTARAEVVSSVEPEVDVSGATALLTVLLRVPGVYWRDPEPVSWETELVPGPPPEGVAVSGLAGSTAPVTDAEVLIDGPAAGPEVVDVATGAGLRWAGTLTAGQTLAVDCAAMSARRLSADVPAGEDVTGLVTAFGPGSASRWLHLTPVLTGGDPHRREVRVRADAVSAAAGARVRITTRRAFL